MYPSTNIGQRSLLKWSQGLEGRRRRKRRRKKKKSHCGGDGDGERQ